MITTIRRGMHLIPIDRRRKFVLVGLLAVVVTVLEAVSAIMVLLLMRLVLNRGRLPTIPLVGDLRGLLPNMSYEQMVTVGAVIFGIFFAIRAIVFLIQQYAMAKVIENTGVVLSAKLVNGYLSMPYEFHLKRNSSELIRNAYDNVHQLTTGVFTPVLTVVAESFMVVGLLLVLVVTSPLVTFITTMAMGALVAISLTSVQPRLRAAGEERQQAAHHTLQHLQQGLEGIRDVKVLGRERTFGRSFTDVRQVMARAQYHRSVLMYVPRVMLETSFLLAIVVVLAVAVRERRVDTMLATLGLFAYAGLRLQPSLQKIAIGLNSVRYAEPVIDNLNDELALVVESRFHGEPDAAGLVPLKFSHSIEFQDVSFRYDSGDRYALSGINIAIRAGQSIGVCGETGGGKSTFLDLLCGLLEPTSGRILIDGMELSGRTRAWQKNIGVVHQSSFLTDDTLRNNIALGVGREKIDNSAVQRATRLAELGDVVTKLPNGLDTVVGERGARLSGGQRQRVTLARALYRHPAMLVLDEGTSALDNVTEAKVMRNLARAADGATLVIVAHRLSTIERCDDIIFIENGHVVATGTYDELTAGHASFRSIAAQ